MPDSAERLVSPVLVGRAEQLDRLVAVVSSPPAVAVVAGEAGVGKTRLVEELLARQELAGSRVLVGRSRPIREPFPLGAVIEAVRGLGGHLEGLALGPVAGALRPLLPELAEWLPPALESLDDRLAERHRVFRGLVELLAALAAARPVVLVLEDLHWADAQTREFIAYWLSGTWPGLALVLTYRGEDAGPEVATLTARLPRPVGHAHVQLAPLDASGTGALASAILGVESVSAEFAGYLHERTGGLPLAVEEVLALVRARGLLVHQVGGWARRALEELDVPRGIRDPTLQRVAGLDGAARQVVEAAALLAVPSTPPVLLATTGPLEGPIAAVEQALGSGLLAEQGELIGFRHVLAAEAVYESLSGPRRRELHGRAAAALRGTSPVPLGRVAYHLQHSGDLEAWVDAAEAAADQAIALGHEEEAMRLLTEVLASGSLPPGRRAELAIKLGWAALDTLGAGATMGLLSQAVEEAPLPGQRAELQFLLTLALFTAGENTERQRSLLADAIPNLEGRPDLLAWALVAMAIVSLAEVPVAEDVMWLNRALDAVDGVGDRLLQVLLLGKVGSVLVLFGDPVWRAVTSRVVRITGDAPRQRREANAYWSVGLAACYAGHLPDAGRLLARGLQAEAARENRRIATMLRSGLALLRLLEGSWAGLAEEAGVLLDELSQQPMARVDVEVVYSCLMLARGGPDEAAERLRAVSVLEEMGAYEILPLWAGAAARVALARGDLAEALGAVSVLRDAMRDKPYWPTACWALPAAVETWMSAGQEAEARGFLDRAEAALGGLDAPLAPAALCCARGILAGSASDLITAADLYEALPVPYEAARARERAAALLFGASQAAVAETQLKAALAAYDRLGASWDHARAARLARQHGVALERRHAGGRRSYGTELSPQERTVAELAATGHTNKEIAAKLFIARPTVDKHMASVIRKMGARSRAELGFRLASGELAGHSKDGEFTP